MKNLKVGLMAMSMLVGGYFGSVFGIGIAFCAVLIAEGAFEVIRTKKTEKKDSQKEEK